MVSDKRAIEKLNLLSQNSGSEIYFEGEIVKAPVELNYKWFKEGNISTNNIITNFVIKEIHIKDKIKMFYIGLILIGFSIVRFMIIGGIKRRMIRKGGV